MQFPTATRRMRYGAACAVILACASVAAAGSRPQNAAGDASKAPTATTHTATKPSSTGTKPTGTAHTATAKHSSHRKKSARVRGQQKIDSERARTIQEALIREHYLTGEATGTWNQACEDAMRKYQGDHGWQTKEVPDSRALIKLGLGPSKDHLLNPESAMTTSPDAPRSNSAAPTSQTARPVSAPPTQTPLQSDPPSPQ